MKPSESSMALSPILMNDFSRQWQEIGADCMSAVDRVGRSGWYVLGTEVSTFETQLAEFCGVKHAVACANGLDAIEIALSVRADRILTQWLSFRSAPTTLK
jgi:dTDP-3-amino-3,4,6-trideoxy-alpha-D-glucose transaminase